MHLHMWTGHKTRKRIVRGREKLMKLGNKNTCDENGRRERWARK